MSIDKKRWEKIKRDNLFQFMKSAMPMIIEHSYKCSNCKKWWKCKGKKWGIR